MLIRYLKDYGPHQAGREFDHPAPGVATELILRGIAVEVVETKTASPIEEPPPKPQNQAPKRRG
jgi:hypothetical protein